MLPAEARELQTARRADRMHVGRTFFPERVINARYPERFSPTLAPDPVRDSNFIGGHGTGVLPARQQIALTEDIARWSEWEQDRFRGPFFKVFFRALANRNVVQTRGQGTWGNRRDIERTTPDSYANQFDVSESGVGINEEDYYFPGGG